MFISPAYAQMPSFISPELMNFVPIILIFLLMYFLILRPQSKKAKQHRDMLEAIRRGDRVLTAGGIIGTVSKIENDQEIQVEIAENVRVRIAKATITQVLAKTEPLKTDHTSSGKLSSSTQDPPQEEPKKAPAKKLASSKKKPSKAKK
jgi:preprotein translocase subunit YajC